MAKIYYTVLKLVMINKHAKLEAMSEKAQKPQIWPISLSQIYTKIRKINFVATKVVRKHQHVKFEDISSILDGWTDSRLVGQLACWSVIWKMTSRMQYGQMDSGMDNPRT